MRCDRLAALALALLLAPPSNLGAEPSPEPAEAWLLTGARVLDAEGERLLEGVAVRVTGGRIAAIAPAGELSLVPARALDLSGLTLIPPRGRCWS